MFMIIIIAHGKTSLFIHQLPCRRVCSWEVTEYVVVDCAAAGKHSAGERNGPDRGGGLSVTEHSGFGVIGQVLDVETI